MLVVDMNDSFYLTCCMQVVLHMVVVGMTYCMLVVLNMLVVGMNDSFYLTYFEQHWHFGFHFRHYVELN